MRIWISFLLNHWLEKYIFSRRLDFLFLSGLVNDIRQSKNRKRNSVKINLWNPKPGQKLVIPYAYSSSIRPEIKTHIEVAIKAMNKHLQCDHDAWVPYKKNEHDHYVEFVKDGGYVI